MAQRKCESCGATMTVADNITGVVNCEFCGNEFAVARSADEIQAAQAVLELQDMQETLRIKQEKAQLQAEIELQQLQDEKQKQEQQKRDAQVVMRSNAKKAVASLIVGIVSLGLSLSLYLVFFAAPAALVGFGIGWSARKDENIKTRSRAKAGLVVSGVSVLASIAILVWFFMS